MMPWGCRSSSGMMVGGMAWPVAGVVATLAAEVVAMCEVTVTAMRPGRMTRKGKNILGMAAMRGTRRAGGPADPPHGRLVQTDAVTHEPPVEATARHHA